MNNKGKLATEATIGYAEHLRDTIAKMAASGEADLELLFLMAHRLAGSLAAGQTAYAVPCDIGDDIWWVDEWGDVPSIECDKGGVAGFVIDSIGVRILDRDGAINEIKYPHCLLSKEAAVEACVRDGDC